MPELSADKTDLVSLRFYIANLAASQTAVALSPPGEATDTDLPEIPVPWAGSIVGISAVVESARTGGICTVLPTINGSNPSGCNAVIDDDPTQYQTSKYRRGQFSEGLAASKRFH